MNRKTVLIADDDEDVRHVVRMQLERFPYRLLEARTGEEVLRIARADKPDAILLDWILPGITGAELLRALRADPALQDIRVIVMTGEEQAVRDAHRFGAQESILKPFTPRHLADKLEHVLMDPHG